jgi:hypothetical protein
MPHSEGLKERAARCLQRAEDLFADAETLRRFGEELAEMAGDAAPDEAAADADRRGAALSA